MGIRGASDRKGSTIGQWMLWRGHFIFVDFCVAGRFMLPLFTFALQVFLGKLYGKETVAIKVPRQESFEVEAFMK